MARTAILDAMRPLAICLLVLCLSFAPTAEFDTSWWLQVTAAEQVPVSVAAPEPGSAPIVADGAKNGFAASTSIPQGSTASSRLVIAYLDSGSIPPSSPGGFRYTAAVYPADPSRAPPLLS